MFENKEKLPNNMILEENQLPLKIPRTFVFDNNIPDDQYHLYIDPEEYYNEEFDTCKDEFQNYRNSNQKKKLQKVSRIKVKHEKNIRLCQTTQNNKREIFQGTINETLSPEILPILEKQKMYKTDAFPSKSPGNLDIMRFGNLKNLQKIKGRKQTAPELEKTKKEMELSTEIRDNDKTHIIIEKTKRAIKKNEIQCEKLKRKVNDGCFFL